MAQNSNLLTASVVGKALRAGEPCVLHDGSSMVLEVTGKNRGKWLFKGRIPGSRNLIKLICGYAPETSLSEARSKRDEFRLLLKQGINPNKQKKQEREEARQKEQRDKMTFNVVANEYLATRQDMSAKSIQGDTARLQNHAKAILHMPMAEITRRDHLKPIVDAILQNRSYEQAKRTSGLISRVFRFAVDQGYIEASPAERLSTMLPRMAPGWRKHHAAQTKEEDCRALFHNIWKHIETGRSSLYVVNAIKLICYVPIRSSNLVGAKWKDIDLDNKNWHFPKTKNGRPYDLPMSRQVYEIFKYLIKYADEETEYCFPSYGKSGHIVNNSIRDVLRAAGITKEEQTVHGFRSTFQSICLEVGIPKLLTERALFHVAGGQTEQAYNRTTYIEPTKAVLQWWADAVDAMREGEQLPDIPDSLLKGGAFQ